MTLNTMPGGRYNKAASSAVVYRLNIAKSYALLEEKVNAYNERQSEKKHMIKGVHYSFAKKLIELFAGTFANFQTKINYSFHPHTPLPYLVINNQTLAEWIKCTDRTVRNYRAKLVELGLITETIFHGSNKPYEIQLNPAFLWLAVNTTTTRVALPEVQNFPLTCSGYPEQGLTGTVSGKKLEPGMAVADAVTVLELQEPGNWNESQENHAPVGATGTPTGTPPGCGAPPTESPESRDQRRLARLLLAYALPLLFPQKRYWPPAEKGRMEAQAARLFAGVTELNMQKVLDNYFLRVLMAAHHYARVAGVPLPHPEVFFNPDIETGFAATRYWPHHPEQFPVQQSRQKPRVRTVKSGVPGRTGQIELGQLVALPNLVNC